MMHDEAIHTLAPLARERAPQTRDVTADVMRDVRRLSAAPADDDRRIWRIAALLSATLAASAIVASVALAPADNPLVEFAQQTTATLEIR